MENLDKLKKIYKPPNVLFFPIPPPSPPSLTYALFPPPSSPPLPKHEVTEWGSMTSWD